MNITVMIYETNFTISHAALQDQSLRNLLNYDCKMRLVYDGKTLFDDWICPLELYKAMTVWKQKLLSMQFDKFEYISEDNSVNPIFAFEYIKSHHSWAFFSAIYDVPFVSHIRNEAILNFLFSYEQQLFALIK